MPTTMTFDSLKQDMVRYLERGSTSAADPRVFEQIPSLINNAERRVATELKVQGFIKPVTFSLVAGLSVYAKPDRWRDTISMNVGLGTSLSTRTPIFPRSYEYCRTYWPDESLTDEPKFYADYDYQHWLIVPTPLLTYPAEALYYEQPAFLDDTNQSNWITDYAPQLLLYAALLEATPFLKNDERIATWQTMYDRAAAMINGQDLAKILDRSSSRKEA